MNSPPLSVCSSHRANGRRRLVSSTPAPTRLIPIPQMGWISVQPVATSTTVSVVRKNPSRLSPQCNTRSACTEPGWTVLPFAPGADRYLRFQSCRRRSRPPRLPAQSFSPTPQLAVDRRRAHRDQSFTQACIQAQFAVSLQTCHQGRQHCGQQLAAHSVARFPYLHEGLLHLRPVAWRPAPLLRHDSQSATPSQEPDRRLPVYARRLAKLIEDPALLLFSGPPVPWPHRSRVLVQGQPSHVTSFR